MWRNIFLPPKIAVNSVNKPHLRMLLTRTLASSAQKPQIKAIFLPGKSVLQGLHRLAQPWSASAAPVCRLLWHVKASQAIPMKTSLERAEGRGLVASTLLFHFIVVAPPSCGMEQSPWLCCSQPQPQPIRCWPGALWKEHTSYRSVIVSLIWPLFSLFLIFHQVGGKSPLGELEPWQCRQRAAHDREEPLKPIFAQGTVTLMPISGNSSVEPSSRDSLGQSHEEISST